jgi:TetR/AcrR family tetracycline transcriptional repressor
MGTPAATLARQRPPLTRQRVLETALAMVDAEGLDALSMRRLGAELGVEAMSVYKHVTNKDALLDGIAELLWCEVAQATPDSSDGEPLLRSFAHSVRAMLHRHPQAAPLVFNRAVLPPQLLETFAALLDSLRQAGLDDTTAGQAVRSLCAYAMGYGISELYCFGAWRADAGQPDANVTDVLLWLGRILPPRTPPRLVDAAVSVCDCDPDGDFEAGLDMALRGLRQLAARRA